MPLQNRVDPMGAIHAVEARGMFTGNRGVIHDPATKTLVGRRWTTKAWIICACDYKGKRREVMGRNAPGGGAGWTELFFLDEATALAAGHRPCFTCRRERAKAFAAGYSRAFGVAKPTVQMMDARLHEERLASSSHGRPHAPTPSSSGLSRGSTSIGSELQTSTGSLFDETRHRQQILETSPRMTEVLPDGTMVSDGKACYAFRGGKALRWSFQGYDRATDFGELAGGEIRVITPATTLAVLRAGYRPTWHGSADIFDQHPFG